MNSPQPARIQCHWQNPNDLKETIMLAECEWQEVIDWMAWAQRIFESNQEKRPTNWQPMICDNTSEHFVQ